MDILPLVSVIIPIYNVEAYLYKCVSSVLTQTLKNIEVILVDDGSTDSSGKICDQIALDDSRIRVYHKLNGGLSSARNYGIDKALGKYIIFLDSDDFWFDKDILSLFVNHAENNLLDVVRGEYFDVDEMGCQIETPNISKISLEYQTKVFTSYEMLKYIINGKFFTVLYLYKKESLKTLRFDENRMFQEDIDFAIKYFCQKMRCGYLPIRFYAYRHRKCSIMTTPRITNLTNSFALCNIFYKYAHIVDDERISQFYLYYSIMMYYWTLETVASDLYIHRYKEIEKNIGLVQLRKTSCSRIKEVHIVKFPIQLYVSPFIGVYLFRIKWFLGKILRKLNLLTPMKKILNW